MKIYYKNLLGEYQNGNYKVQIFQDGTKIRKNNLSSLEPQFPESIDLNLSQRCTRGCKFCYQDCTPDGKVADLEFLLRIADNMYPWTEVACNLNTSEDLRTFKPFFERCRDNRVLINITINQSELQSSKEQVQSYQEQNLLWGIGVSLTNPETICEDTAGLKNTVIHTILGVHNLNTYKSLWDQDLKVLMLGYKVKGRGIKFNQFYGQALKKRIQEISTAIPEMIKHFRVLSFDNLALEQLNFKDLGLVDWDKFYMGDDGKFTFYLDAVHQKFYKSSLETEGWDCRDLKVEQMFKVINDK